VPALIEAIRHLHGCEAKHLETVHIHEQAVNGETVWDGDVEVFVLSGHPKAPMAYAWSEATTGTRRRCFAILHAGPVTGAETAVRASILADARAKTQAN
jgi:hypothetical protein